MSGAQEVSRPKYILIVSQYYHSRHMLVVDANMDDAEYYEKARILIDELEQYKRNADDSRPFSYGDMSEKYYKGTSRRYNVNDAGDIYFIPCWSFKQAMYEIKGYWEDSINGRRGYIKKHITQSIAEHHDGFKIKTIIEKHFNIL